MIGGACICAISIAQEPLGAKERITVAKSGVSYLLLEAVAVLSVELVLHLVVVQARHRGKVADWWNVNCRVLRESLNLFVFKVLHEVSKLVLRGIARLFAHPTESIGWCLCDAVTIASIS